MDARQAGEPRVEENEDNSGKHYIKKKMVLTV